MFISNIKLRMTEFHMRREKNKQVKIKDMSSSHKLFNFLDNAIPQMNNYHSQYTRGVLLSQKDIFF